MGSSVVSDVRFPNNSQHLLILGRNGSGKTQAAIFNLSLRNFDKMPWVIVNTKGDATINKIGKMKGVHNIDLDDTPKRAGLYIVRPVPERDDDLLSNFLMRIWQRGRTGIYADEGYMLPKGGATNALLTQGRSKKIPMIILAQRPVWLSRFAFSEASFFQAFDLTTESDRKIARDFMPYDVVESLPPYHSLWYDVNRKRLDKLSPVPGEAELLETFRQRLAPKTRYL
jgi:hypothetical protein